MVRLLAQGDRQRRDARTADSLLRDGGNQETCVARISNIAAGGGLMPVRQHCAEGPSGAAESANDGSLSPGAPDDATAFDAYTIDDSTTTGKTLSLAGGQFPTSLSRQAQCRRKGAHVHRPTLERTERPDRTRGCADLAYDCCIGPRRVRLCRRGDP